MVVCSHVVYQQIYTFGVIITSDYMFVVLVKAPVSGSSNESLQTLPLYEGLSNFRAAISNCESVTRLLGIVGMHL